MLIPFVVSAYLMQVFFLIGLFAGESFAWANYAGLVFTLLTLVFGVIATVKSVTGDTRDTRKETMTFKLLLIPYFVINFIIGFMALLGALVNFMVLPIIVAGVILMLVFNYFMVVVTSASNIRYLIKNLVVKKDPLTLLHIAFHFIFVTDVISSVILALKKD
ncbi:MAG: hypothetical protein BWX57_00611 [Tenericutes bacterium ADurb.Bin024]|jgi:hypothetical protein|nr:MAG: hypothetical protein BWX57_00611 [Tenericutes bacterium ADurb.Bin024]HPK29161.1 hypothetical protein [Bacilli bacterium]